MQKQAQPSIDQAKDTYKQASDKAQGVKDDATAKASELQKAAKDKSQPAIAEANRLKDQASQKYQVSQFSFERYLLTSSASLLFDKSQDCPAAFQFWDGQSII